MSMIIDGARVFDGRRDLGAVRVTVRDGLVVSVGNAADRGNDGIGDATVVDGTGKTLLPALIDAHTHVQDGSLQQAIRFGVGTELDMLNDPEHLQRYRATAAEADAADLRSAVTGATVPGGHPIPLAVETGLLPAFPTVERPEDAKAFVDRVVDLGADYLKVFVETGEAMSAALPHLDGPTVRALVHAAHRHGLRTVAHVTSWAAARLVLDAGIDGLAHVPVDAAINDESLEAVVRSGAFVVTTLSMYEGLCGISAGARLAEDPRVRPHLDPLSLATLTASWPDRSLPTARFDDVCESVGRLYAAGVRVLAGTDAINPGTAHGLSMHRELALLVRSGLSPTAALTAATAVPAATFGLDDRGVIAPGRRADLLLVDGDPTADVRRTLDIAGVWRSGELVARGPHARH